MICGFCAKEFALIRSRKRKYCSRHCSASATQNFNVKSTSTSTTSRERFFDNIFPEPNSGCWIWMGSLAKRDYARIYINRKEYVGSRFSYEIHKGKIPTGMVVRHSCDNTCCVNPDHLLVGTQRDNATDMVIRRRNQKCTKLLPEDISIIRADTRNLSVIATHYGVTGATISLVKRRKTWKHIGE